MAYLGLIGTYIMAVVDVYLNFIRGIFQADDPNGIANNKRKSVRKTMFGGSTTSEKTPMMYIAGRKFCTFVHKAIPSWKASKVIAFGGIYMVAAIYALIVRIVAG